MSSAPDRPDVPDIVLERYRLGELPPADAESLERRLQEDAALRLRLDAIEASDLAMERAGVPDRLAVRVRAHAARTAAPTPSLARAAVIRRFAPAAIAAAAVVLVAVGVGLPGRSRAVAPTTSSSVRPAEGDRVKGLAPALTLFRKTGSGTEKLEEGTVLRAGDLVRVAYTAAGRPYGVIVSIDGRGGVTLHLPASGHAAVRLQPGDRVLLEQAYELDDAPRWEKFYLITGNAPFEIAPILDAARRAGAAAGSAGPRALDLAPGLEQVGLSFIKEGKS